MKIYVLKQLKNLDYDMELLLQKERPMSTRIRQLIDVPDNLVQEIIRSYYRDGALTVVPKPMADGTWVVIAEFAGEKTAANTPIRTAAS
jgi:hypothetical protein